MYFFRKKLPYLHNLIKKEPAVILIGSRQVGKTTLMQKMEQDLRESGEKTFYFSLELPSNLEIFSSGPEGVLEYFKAQGVDFEGPAEMDPIFIFLDEFQYIPNAGKMRSSFWRTRM